VLVLDCVDDQMTGSLQSDYFKESLSRDRNTAVPTNDGAMISTIHNAF
jgi:hypothetical protein